MAKINPFLMYGNLVYQMRTYGKADKVAKMGSDEIHLGFNKSTGDNYVTYYFQLKSFYTHCDYELFAKFRNSIRMSYGRRVFVDIVTRNKPYSVNWNSRALKDNRNSWREKKQRVKKSHALSEEAGYADDHINELSVIENKKEYSWRYYKLAESRGESGLIYSLIFRIKIPKDDLIYANNLLSAVDQASKAHTLKVDMLKICLKDYLNELSPFKHVGTKFASNLLSERTLTTGVTTKLYSTADNRLPQHKLILGLSRFSKKIVSLDVLKELVSGCNMFILGNTGSGKSTLLKSINENILALDIYFYLIDYEKNEYKPMGDRYGAKYLDFGGIEGYYYEPLRLGVLSGDYSIDSEIYKNAVSNYISYVTVFHGEKLTSSQKLILTKAVSETFESYGVDPNDMATWKKGKQIMMKEVYPNVRKRKFSNQDIATYGKELTSLIDTLELYFDEKSPMSSMMKKPISFDEYKDAKIIITKFGVDSSADLDSQANVLVEIKQLSKMLLDQELSRYRRSRKEAFAMEYEEVQRFIKNTGSKEMLNTTYTGIRKANGFAISVLNDPKLLNDELKNLISNSKYLIIGKVGDLSTIKDLFNMPILSGCEGIVKRLNYMKNYFFINSTDEFQSIFKVHLPDYMLNSDIYKTVDVDKS